MPLDTLPDVDGVVLVRLLVRPKKLTLATLAADLLALLWLPDRAASRKAAEGSVARLKERGLVWRDTKFILTDEGTAAALAQLGYSQLPKRQRLDWRWAKKALIVQRFRLAASAVAHAGKSEHLAAWLLAHKEGLHLGTAPTPAAVLQALAWRSLGLPDKGPLAENAGVGALLGLVQPEPGSGAHAPAGEPAPPAIAAPARQAKAPPRSAVEDLPTFGRRVNELALHAEKGVWLGNKVFIAQVWRDFRRQEDAGELSLAAFKRRLVESARAGQVLLSRADLIGAYPQDELRESQIEAGGELYHFVETQHLR